MIVNVIEIFTEYLSIIFCLHRVAEKKIVIDKYVIIFFVGELLSILIAERYRNQYSWIMIFVYIIFLLYAKVQLCKKWREAIKKVCITLIIISCMQLLIYFGTKFIYDSIIDNKIVGIFINCINSLILVLWKKEYLIRVARRLLNSTSSIIIFLFSIFMYLIYMYRKSDFIYGSIIIRVLSGIVGVGIILILWMNAEYEKKSKAKELQLYQLYNKTFEEAVDAIRRRQHEFDNHINAIKCLQLTIENPNDLIKAQNEYCDNVLKDNSFSKLLKLHNEPILAGFLYSKFINAKEQGISINYELHTIDIKGKIEIYELIEIIGIFIDNAIEALSVMDDNEKKLIVKILQEDTKKVSIEIANRSRKYLNTEIEKFCNYGYSTKGKNRGIGLSRVKEIVKKYKADFLIENIKYNGDIYLSFKIIF